MGNFRFALRSFLVRVNPFMSGSITSSRARSGLFFSAILMASCAFFAVRISNPANFRLVARSSRMFGSSSTISSFASVFLWFIF